MTINTTPHLNFHGNAREALEFYRDAFDGHLTAITYGDFGLPADRPDAANIVWGQVESANGFRVMAYDIPGHAGPAAPHGKTWREHGQTLTGQPFFLSVRGDSVDEVGALWSRLTEGATIIEPYAPTQWSPSFGMLTDRFGVTWILDVAAPYTA